MNCPALLHEGGPHDVLGAAAPANAAPKRPHQKIGEWKCGHLRQHGARFGDVLDVQHDMHRSAFVSRVQQMCALFAVRHNFIVSEARKALKCSDCALGSCAGGRYGKAVKGKVVDKRSKSFKYIALQRVAVGETRARSVPCRKRRESCIQRTGQRKSDFLISWHLLFFSFLGKLYCSLF